MTDECIPRHYGISSSFVCVCNSSFCDSAPVVGDLTAGQATLISSTRADARFRIANLTFAEFSKSLFGTFSHGFAIPLKPVNEIFIDASVRYQSIFGFGGAFTDAAGINIAKLSFSAQHNLMK